MTGKISELSAIDALASDDLFEVLDDSEVTPGTLKNKSVTPAQVTSFVLGNLVGQANTFTATQTITLSAAFAVPLSIVSTDADAARGPILMMDRNSASPAVNDALAAATFRGRNSGGSIIDYFRLDGSIVSPTAAAEAGRIVFRGILAGTASTQFGFIGAGLVMGNPTGGDKGIGTINATAVYDDNVLLTDVVQDAIATGDVDLEKWDAMVPDTVIPAFAEEVAVMEDVEVDDVALVEIDGGLERRSERKKVRRQAIDLIPVYVGNDGVDAIERPLVDVRHHPERIVPRVHDGARVLKAMMAKGFDPGDYKSVLSWWKQRNTMPCMPSAKEWDQGKFSLGEMTTRQNMALEILIAAMANLTENIEKRLAALEKKRK